MKRIKVSNNVIRRLPRYLRKLDELTAQGISRISSFELGQQLGLTPSQIRQDFSCFGEFGQQGYGYSVTMLHDQIANILGMDRNYKAILIGVGHIGSALIDNFQFSEWGVELVRAFDIDKEKIGKEHSGVLVSSSEDIVPFLKDNKIDIAVLCVSKEVAPQVTNVLTENGINAIWNFTNVEIVKPGSSAIVENVHFSDSLLSLSYFISEENDARAAHEARIAKTSSKQKQ